MSQQPSRVSPELVLATRKGQARPVVVTAEQAESHAIEEELNEGVRPATKTLDKRGVDEASKHGTMAPSHQANPVPPMPSGPPLRQGKVALNFRLHPEMHQQLRRASYNTGTSIQQIVETAVRELLQRMGVERG